MGTVLVTGSTRGIGLAVSRTLARRGHDVLVHARDARRAATVARSLPEAADIVVGDLSSLAETRALAERVSGLGPLDAIVHNAGSYDPGRRRCTRDGLERTFQINVVAPYLVSALTPAPARLVFLGSDFHFRSDVRWDDPQSLDRPWDGVRAYADSKLHVVQLALAMARLRPDSVSNAVDPGWVKTRMGGPEAPDGIALGADGPVWLAAGVDARSLISGRYLRRREVLAPHPQASDRALQDRLLDELSRLCGVSIPAQASHGQH